MKSSQKGTFNYIDQKKKLEIIKTITFFALSAAIFTIGYVTTKTKGNLLTVVAVLGCLPASKCAVNMIMVLKIKKCSLDAKEKIIEAIGNLNGYYNLYFTSYDKNFSIAHLIVTTNSIIAFSEVSSINAADFEKHIEQILGKDGIKDMNVKLFTDLSKYVTRLNQLNESSVDIMEKENVKNLLFSVSL